MKTTTYELRHNGDLWRVEADDYRNRRYLTFRKWYLKDGEWTPTKAGFTMPPSAIPGLIAGLQSALVALVPDGLPSAADGVI